VKRALAFATARVLDPKNGIFQRPLFFPMAAASLIAVAFFEDEFPYQILQRKGDAVEPEQIHDPPARIIQAVDQRRIAENHRPLEIVEKEDPCTIDFTQNFVHLFALEEFVDQVADGIPPGLDLFGNHFVDLFVQSLFVQDFRDLFLQRLGHEGDDSGARERALQLHFVDVVPIIDTQQGINSLTIAVDLPFFDRQEETRRLGVKIENRLILLQMGIEYRTIEKLFGKVVL